jgi:hypothetical protein
VGAENLELQGKHFVEMLVDATLRAAGTPAGRRRP